MNKIKVKKLSMLIVFALISNGCHTQNDLSIENVKRSTNLYTAENDSRGHFVKSDGLSEYIKNNNSNYCKLMVNNDELTFKYVLFNKIKRVTFDDVTCILSNSNENNEKYINMINEEIDLSNLHDKQDNNILHYAIYNNHRFSIDFIAKNLNIKTFMNNNNIHGKYPNYYLGDTQ